MDLEVHLLICHSLKTVGFIVLNIFLNVLYIVPSGYPQQLFVDETTPDSLTLSWAPPPSDEQNGAIIGYVINVTHADTLQTTQYYSTYSNITITNLDPYTTYVCVVAAETSIGVGPFSHLFFVQTEEAGIL